MEQPVVDNVVSFAVHISSIRIIHRFTIDSS
jgi:hypothetical protein